MIHISRLKPEVYEMKLKKMILGSETGKSMQKTV